MLELARPGVAWVLQKGQIIAELERFAAHEATVARIEAQLANAEAENCCTDELTADSYLGSAMV